MPQREYTPQSYTLVQENGYVEDSPKVSTELHLESTDDIKFHFSFQAVRPGLFRTTFSSKTHPLPPHPAAPRPTADFSGVKPSSTSTAKSKTIAIGDVTATVDWTGPPIVSLQLEGQKTPIHKDLDFRSYVVDSEGIAHYTRYKRDTLHVGLGEKAAPMNLSNRNFIISATDSFGYDVYRTDPLYKHIPLLINATPEGCVGIFSTSHSRGTYAVGSEIDGLWGHFKVYRQDYGGLEEYLMVGKTIQDVVRIYAELVGYPLLVPRWAFGYIAGGMKYSMLDEPRACDALVDFAEKLKTHDIPCSAFQMSSGYTVAETEPKTRNVFTWNKHRFPDPEGFLKKYHDEGIRLIANVKPYVLANHPEYPKLVESGALFSDPRTKKSAVARLWSAGGGESGEGGHIDFTSEAGFKWWYEGVKALRKVGIEGIWNDNNEYTIPDDGWELALNGNDKEKPDTPNHIGIWGRAMHTELMGQSSHDALIDLEPEIRPFVLTRSATAGTMRYAASSWGGDNVTSWDNMKGSNSLSLNAGMSLLQCYGHDIGGFEGPQPSPELLLRWVQLGVYSPRFAINCFKTDENDNTIGGVIEPWMYPEITPLVRDIIKRRYELIPYLYSLMLESHATAVPPQRWIGHSFESDPEVWTPEVMAGETQYWLGKTILVGGVYLPGETKAKLYLPTTGAEDEGYINMNSPYNHLPAGKWVEINSPWKDSIPLLARVGGVIVVGKGSQTRSPGDHRFPSKNETEDDVRAVEIFPPQGVSKKTYEYTWYEDDGISRHPEISSFTLKYSSTAEKVEVELVKGEGNKYIPLWKELSIILPVGDSRPVVLTLGDARAVLTHNNRNDVPRTTTRTPPRLILRSATLSDANASTQVRSNPLNSEFGGVVNATYTVEQQEKALERQKGSTASGEHAWLVVILKDGEGTEGVEGLRVEDGWLIGMTGYNPFPRERGSATGDGKEAPEVLVGDTGVLIDHHFQRRGYALEALEMVVQVGLEELGIEVVFWETDWGNEPFRGLMRSAGLGDLEKEGGGDGQGRSVVYRCGTGRWERSKEGLRKEGKWYL